MLAARWLAVALLAALLGFGPPAYAQEDGESAPDEGQGPLAGDQNIVEDSGEPVEDPPPLIERPEEEEFEDVGPSSDEAPEEQATAPKPAEAAPVVGKLVGLATLAASKPALALPGLRSLLKRRELEPWARQQALVGLAGALAATGDAERALRALDRAVRMGYDGWFVLRNGAPFKELRADRRFKELYARLRMSRADALEARWALTADRANAGGPSRPQVRIPDRPTRSPTVLWLRQRLAYSHARPRGEFVLPPGTSTVPGPVPPLP